MNEALSEALIAIDSLPGIAALLAVWLLHRLSPQHPIRMAGRAGRAFAASLGLGAPADPGLVMENLRQLLDEQVWANLGMSSWRKKAVDAWLDELVDQAIGEQLSVSEPMARFAAARRAFHEAIEPPVEDDGLWMAMRQLSAACEHLSTAVQRQRQARGAAPQGSLTVLA